MRASRRRRRDPDGGRGSALIAYGAPILERDPPPDRAAHGLAGAIYGQGYRDLQRGALAYVQATSVGGTHPALVESMGAGNLVLAFRTPENELVS